MDQIQASFGTHNVSGISAHTGSEAASAADQMGAQAYATGNAVAFGSSSPDLHTTAHEAAHVIQQKAGVQLKGGVGQAGDVYERHADAVADRVVAGESAQGLLDDVAGNPAEGTLSEATSVQRMVADFVQFIGKPLETPLGGEEPPVHGEDAGKQRRYSVEQYIEMWEEEQGRKLTEAEKTTLARGCIGITALNLTGGGNPPLDNAYGTFEQAHAAMVDMNDALDGAWRWPWSDNSNDNRAILFAKLFWSNQSPDREERKKPDDSAFRPDPTTGKVDMSGYEYRAQPDFVNFDYGFWDESTQSFWHANHSMPGMEVYQSTREKFAGGYTDFDRVIYCVGIAENYDASLAAEATVESGPAETPDVVDGGGGASDEVAAEIPNVEATVSPDTDTDIAPDVTAEIPNVEATVLPADITPDSTAEIPNVEATVLPADITPDSTAEIPDVEATVLPADITPDTPRVDLPPPAPAAAAARPGGDYVVQPGDSLSAIALRAYGSVDYWRLIMEANPDSVHDGGATVHVGETLVLPAAASSASAPAAPSGESAASVGGSTPETASRGGTEYIIQPGDTLGTIASRVYGDSRHWTAIMAANPGRVRDGGDLIYVGDTLVLPALDESGSS